MFGRFGDCVFDINYILTTIERLRIYDLMNGSIQRHVPLALARGLYGILETEGYLQTCGIQT